MATLPEWGKLLKNQNFLNNQNYVKDKKYEIGIFIFSLENYFFDILALFGKECIDKGMLVYYYFINFIKGFKKMFLGIVVLLILLLAILPLSYLNMIIFVIFILVILAITIGLLYILIITLNLDKFIKSYWRKKYIYCSLSEGRVYISPEKIILYNLASGNGLEFKPNIVLVSVDPSQYLSLINFNILGDKEKQIYSKAYSIYMGKVVVFLLIISSLLWLLGDYVIDTKIDWGLFFIYVIFTLPLNLLIAMIVVRIKSLGD